MQNFIIIVLIAGLGFFLYLIQSGEIDSSTFAIRNTKNLVQFEIEKLDSISLQKSEVLYLNIKNSKYTIFNSTGISFTRVPRSEYYMNIYDIPLEAKDAVTATWLGYRYVFYVIEEIDYSSKDSAGILYQVYKTEYPTDSVDPVVYKLFKSIRGLDVGNAIDVRY
jgi:hypothetical protein